MKVILTIVIIAPKLYNTQMKNLIIYIYLIFQWLYNCIIILHICLYTYMNTWKNEIRNKLLYAINRIHCDIGYSCTFTQTPSLPTILTSSRWALCSISGETDCRGVRDFETQALPPPTQAVLRHKCGNNRVYL